LSATRSGLLLEETQNFLRLNCVMSNSRGKGSTVGGIDVLENVVRDKVWSSPGRRVELLEAKLRDE
jgi:hypothetical protein